MPADPAAEEMPDSADETACILIAEDDPTVRTLIARALTRHGFRVIEAGDGASAIEQSKKETPHLAIIDLRMPRMDGYEVVAILKGQERSAALPVLVLSGMDEPEERVRAFEAGADDFIPKPVSIRELLKRVDAFERQRRAFLALHKANERADRLRLFVAEAAALLAHDLNNGLSIATANLSYLDEVLELEGEEKDALAGTMRALHRMNGLVSNFVDINRLEDAAIKPDRKNTDVYELLQSAALIHDPRRAPGDKGIQVVCEVGFHANIDPVLIERVIHNLLNNATRYVNKGGDIALFAKPVEIFDQKHLHIGVGNTGIRIPEGLRANLFSKYRKGSDGKAQRGMGLYFCRLACEAHGGSIDVVDDPVYTTYFSILVSTESQAASGSASPE